jgi:hypothetical protein
MPKNDSTGNWETYGGEVSHRGSGDIKVTQGKGGKSRGFRRSQQCLNAHCVEVAVVVDGIVQ